MRIKSIKLKDYRNYSSLELSFSNFVNILLGKNAQGKTNLLEAIFTCAVGKSMRASKDSEVIKWGEEKAKIELEIEKKFGYSKIEIYFIKNKKAIKINNLPIKRISELLGEIRCVFFSPDELKLIKESPEDRRRFMDIDLSQTSKIYFNLLNRYEIIISSRNKLLKNFKDKHLIKKNDVFSINLDEFKSMISIYNLQLAECASKITLSRHNLITSLKPYANMCHAFLTKNEENLQIEYQAAFSILQNADNNIYEILKNKFISLYEKSLEKDITLGYTTIGPHRDDIKVLINGVDVKSFGSQGQQRTAALSLKLAELEIIYQKTGEMPVLLLDDVLSELDSDRRKRLLKFCSKTQTFITTTEIETKIPNSKIIKIKAGENINN